jgi:hypothetical protein
MSNKELMPASVQEITSLGKLFFESGMFQDIKSASQAVVKIAAGREIGIPPFAAMSGIHIIQGKPSIGAGLMASMVKASGKYNYKVLQQDEKVCSIDYYEGKEKIGNSTFTIEDAKKAGTKNIDKFPKNMLFARAMSNGVRWFTPDIFAGPVYTPEEIGAEDIDHEEIKPTITNGAFEKLLDRICNGEDMVQKAKDTISLNAEQLKQIDYYQSWYTEINKQANGELEQLAAAHANELNDPRIKQMFDKRSREIGV